MKRARVWVFGVLCVLGLLTSRALLEGRAAVRRADECLRGNDTEGAIAHAMRAAKWYVPFAAHPREGYDRLRDVARRAESTGDADTALVAWQAIRAAAKSTRSFYVPYQDRLDEADQRIAALLVSKPPPGVDKDKGKDALLAEHRALLARDDAPRPLAVIALYLGLVAWMVGAYRVARELDAFGGLLPSDRDGRKNRLLYAAATAGVGIVVFFLALTRA